MSDRDVLAAAFAETARLHQQIAADRPDEIIQAATAISRALAAGNKVLAFGNGGSATDAQHLAGELVGRFLRERRPVPVIALTADSCTVTALGNDYGYDAVFARQI